MKIDAHQHFWQFDPVRDAWITDDMSVIQRDFLPEDLYPILEENDVDACVAVQADQSEKETEFLLGLAQSHPWIKGVVGWVDLLSPELENRLDFYKQNPAFKGVRHILQAEASGFMTQKAFVNGVSQLMTHDLTYDILTTESQLPEVVDFVKALPEMSLVIDHLSKPNIKEASFDQWKKNMERISQYEHVCVKLSGMVTEADWQNWDDSTLKPYVDACLEMFGPSRLMFGSDWPVCLLAGSYQQVYDSLKTCINELTPSEQQQILGGTATSFYKLD